MKKLNTCLLLLGLIFLGYLVWKIGPENLWQQIAALGWGVVPLILIEGAGNVAHTLGWRKVICRGQEKVSLLSLFGMAMSGYAINYLTPSASVGGDVTRAALLASRQKGKEPEAISSVLLDKLTTATAHVLLAILGAALLLWRVTLPAQLWAAMAFTTVLLIAGLVAFLLLQKHGKLGGFLRWLADRKIGGRALNEAAQSISNVDEALKRFYRERPRDLVVSVWWHLIGHSAAIFQAWFFLSAFNQPSPLVTVAGAGLLSLWFDLLTFAVPLNLGTLEGSRIVVFKALGCGALLGMAFGVAIRIAQVSWACFGMVSYIFLTTGKRAAKERSNVSRSFVFGRQVPGEANGHVTGKADAHSVRLAKDMFNPKALDTINR